MKKILLIVAFVIIACGGLYYYRHDQAQRLSGERGSSENVSAKRSPSDERTKIVGTWRSTEDSKFIRVFNADGTTEDRYEGDPSATMAGEWNIFTSTNPDPGYDRELATDTTYLKIQSQYEALFFRVLSVSDTNLELSYLDRGNTLSFTKVQ